VNFEKISRRGMIKLLAGASFAASPILASAAIAGDETSKANIKMQARIVFEPHIPTALRRALQYAGDDGFVASMPQLMHARTTAPFDNIIWNTWFTANSEESVVTTPQGNHVVVAVHGGGIFGSPERFERSLNADQDRSNQEGLTGQTAAKITAQEALDLLGGRLPDGTLIPVYPFEEFRQGIANLPRRYGVILDFELARQSKRGFETFEA